MLVCHLALLQLGGGDEELSEEEEEVSEDLCKEVLRDALAVYGLVQQVSTMPQNKKRRRIISFAVQMHKQSEALKAANGLNGLSLPLTALTSSLVRTQFLGPTFTKLALLIPASAPSQVGGEPPANGMANITTSVRRRFSCCGNLTKVEIVEDGESGAQRVHLSFDSNLGVLRALEDFEERQGMSLLPNDTRLTLLSSAAEEEEEQTPLTNQQAVKRVQTAAVKRARAPELSALAKDDESGGSGGGGGKDETSKNGDKEEETQKRPKSEVSANTGGNEGGEENELLSRRQLFIVHSKQVTVEELERIFSAEPGCAQVEVMRTKKKQDLVRGTSFVTFDTVESARAAQEKWDGLEFPPGNMLKAMFARSPRFTSAQQRQRAEDDAEHEPPPNAAEAKAEEESCKTNADALIDSFGNAMAALGPITPQSPPAFWSSNSNAMPVPERQSPPQQWIDYSQQQQAYFDFTPMMPPQYFVPEMYATAAPWPAAAAAGPVSPAYYSPMPASPLQQQQQSHYQQPPPRMVFILPSSGGGGGSMMHEQHADNSRLYVSYARPSSTTTTGLQQDPITEEHIRQFFSAAAPDLYHVYRVKDKPVFFVKYRNSMSAMQAMMRLNGFSLNGCTLRVVLADPPRVVVDSTRSGGHRHSHGGGGGSINDGSSTTPYHQESESKRRRDE